LHRCSDFPHVNVETIDGDRSVPRQDGELVSVRVRVAIRSVKGRRKRCRVPESNLNAHDSNQKQKTRDLTHGGDPLPQVSSTGPQKDKNSKKTTREHVFGLRDIEFDQETSPFGVRLI